MADRTDEFFSMARSIPATGAMSSIRAGGSAPTINSSQTSGDTSHRSTSSSSQQNNPALAELRTFRMAASEISRDVSTTSSLLAELSRLVKIGAGGTRMFADESANQRADALVLRIKSNVEGLHSRLEEASVTLDRSKRRLGKNSQAGMEASNLVGQLKEDFVKTTSGFKAVLEERSDGMKDTNDRKRRVIGGGEGGGLDGNAAAGGEEERVDLLTLMNKPAVYGGNDQRNSTFGGDMGGMGGGGLGGGGGSGGMPSLDLTSGMMAMAQRHQDEMGGLPAGESSSQLPRPHGISGYDSQGLRLRHSNSASFESPGAVPSYSGATSSYYPESSHNQSSVPLTPMEIQQMESESGQQRQYQLIPDQDYLRQRADAMTTVETNIVELGTIFNKLAVMVNEHRDMVQRVEDNVDDANTHLNLSMATLTDTLQNLQTNRALMAKVLGIVVLFIIMFIIFFA
mmetsp:Transcript_2328/g.4954  ORF Transcript_2328/g.4954 Transcript_2328/m.4954 type:complete len:456 (+) Transcript_2328:94-1461(+)|eukprot:CAMPEP_0172326684 /NCGR_PEP_ID=MMETSP1058-20130122/57279_1 /TAXON_ID=83371 /ORGANISM="Detonula confervacea, Strain CCMP 353" /LENGTH=455 /DNA_ID=CAMNT_0013043531 /DNA_START=70 /DNA_END=1437 /DNA_ORIENTATION=+